MLTGTMYRLLVLFNDTDTWAFTDLCTRAGFSPDLGAYYLRRLVHDGYLENTVRGRYTITPAGSLRLSLASNKQNPSPLPQPRVVAVLVPRHGKHGVLLCRAIQPRIGVLEWPGGTVASNEDLPATVRRLTNRYFGKTYPAEFIGFFRKIERSQGGVFDDKLLAVHTVDIPERDVVMPQNEIGTLVLHPWSHILDMPHVPKNLIDIYEFVGMSAPRPYVEKVYDLLPDDFSPTAALAAKTL